MIVKYCIDSHEAVDIINKSHAAYSQKYKRGGPDMLAGAYFPAAHKDKVEWYIAVEGDKREVNNMCSLMNNE